MSEGRLWRDDPVLTEKIARAMFAVDWPRDSWDRLGPGRAQDRYLAMARAALLTVWDEKPFIGPMRAPPPFNFDDAA
jgi:hypothetical protein